MIVVKIVEKIRTTALTVAAAIVHAFDPTHWKY